MHAMVRKVLWFSAWFIAFSAAISLLVTITANSFEFGRVPGGPYRAGEALQEEFGLWYSGSIMLVAALLAAAGVLLGKLPGSREKKAEA